MPFSKDQLKELEKFMSPITSAAGVKGKGALLDKLREGGTLEIIGDLAKMDEKTAKNWALGMKNQKEMAAIGGYVKLSAMAALMKQVGNLFNPLLVPLQILTGSLKAETTAEAVNLMNSMLAALETPALKSILQYIINATNTLLGKSNDFALMIVVLDSWDFSRLIDFFDKFWKFWGINIS